MANESVIFVIEMTKNEEDLEPLALVLIFHLTLYDVSLDTVSFLCDLTWN